MKNEECMELWFRRKSPEQRQYELKEEFEDLEEVTELVAFQYYCYGYDVDLLCKSEKEEKGKPISRRTLAVRGLIDMLNSGITTYPCVVWYDFNDIFAKPDIFLRGLNTNKLRYETVKYWIATKDYIRSKIFIIDNTDFKTIVANWKQLREHYKVLMQQDKIKESIRRKSNKMIIHQNNTIQPGSIVIFNDIHDNTNPTIQ